MPTMDQQAQRSGREDGAAALEAAGSFVEQPESDQKMVVDEKGNFLYETEEQPKDPESISLQSGREAEVVAMTDTGKEIQVVKDPSFSGYHIEFKQGGRIPKEFEGRWTSYEKAMEQIRIYIAKRNDAKPF